MTNEELNKRAAELLGWTVGKEYFSNTLQSEEAYYDDGEFMFWCHEWQPATDHNHVAILMDEIDRLGLRGAFTGALTKLLPLPVNYEPCYPYWRFIYAAPEQKTEAFIAAMEAQSKP